MNKIFRVIWSRTLNVFVVVSELATGRCKSSNSTQVSVGDKLSLLSFTLKPLAALFSTKTITSMASAAVFGSVLFASQNVYAASIVHGGSSIYHGTNSPTGVGGPNFPNQTGSVLLGDNNKRAVENNSVVVGFSSRAKEEGTALGGDAKADARQSLAVGWGTRAKGSQSTAVGNNTFAGGHGAIAIGGDDVGGQGGKAAIVTNGGDVVGRYDSENNTGEYFLTSANMEDVSAKVTSGEVLTSDKDVFFDPVSNKYFKIKRNDSGAIIYDTSKDATREATYKYSKLLPKAVLDKYRAHKNSTFAGVSVGALNENLAKGNSFSNTWAEGKGAIAMGARSVAYGDSSVAIGTMSFALGNNSSVLGSGSFAFGNSSQALGTDTYVYADNSVGVGSHVQAINKGSMAFGHRARSGAEGSITIGTDVYAGVEMDYTAQISYNAKINGVTQTVQGRIHRTDKDNYRLDEADGILTFDSNGSRKVAGENKKLNSGRGFFSFWNIGYIDRLEEAIKYDQAVKPVTELDEATGIIKMKADANKNSIVIGSRSASSGSNNILLGRGVFARDDNSIAIGSYSYTLNKNAIAIGLASHALAKNSIALGVGAVTESKATNSTVVGTGSLAIGENSSLFGSQSSVWGNNSMVLGNNSSSAGPSNIILGNSAKIDRLNESVNSSVENSIVIGHGAEILVRNNENKANMLAIGNKSKAYFANSTAIGYESETDYTLADLQAPAWTAKGSISIPNPQRVGILSVGKIGQERRISNVAAGYRDTDAANVSQLKRIEERIDNLSLGGESNSVRYFSVENKQDATVNALNTLAEHERDYKSYLRLQEQALIVAAREKRGDGIEPAFKTKLTEELNKLKAKLSTRVSTDGKELSKFNVSNTKYGNGTSYNYDQVIQDIADARKRDEAKSALTEAEKRQLEEANFTNLGAKGKNAIAVGYNAKANGEDTVVIGYLANSTKGTSDAGNRDVDQGVAVGRNARLFDGHSVAIGANATVGANDKYAVGGVAVGENAKALAQRATALGNNTEATGDKAFAGGYHTLASGANSIAIGTDGGTEATRTKATGASSIAVGQQSVATQNSAVALGAFSKGNGAQATALGNYAETTGSRSIATGYHSLASGDYAIAIGSANGGRTTASQSGAIALGSKASASVENAMALGTGAAADQAHSVALGSGATTRAAASKSASGALTNSENRSLTFSWTGGTTAYSSISVGNSNQLRQIHHVAAGDVSATSTDAINGSQLYALANTKMLFAGNTGEIGRLLGEKLTIKGKANSGITVATSGTNVLEIDVAKGNLVQGDGVTLTGTTSNRLLGAGDLTVALSTEYKNKINAIKSYEVTNDGNLISVTDNGSTTSAQKWKVGLNLDNLKAQLGQLGATTTLTAGNTNHKIGEKNTTLTITGANGIEAKFGTTEAQTGNGTLTIKLDDATKGKIDKINTIENTVSTVNNKVNTIETKLGSGAITFAATSGTAQSVALGKQFKIEGNNDITATVAADGTAGAKVSLALQKATDIATGGTKVVTADAVKSYVDGATGDKAKSDLSNVDTTALTNKITKGNLNSGSMVEVTGGSSKLIGGDASIDLNAATKEKIGKIGGGTITANDDKTVTGSTVFEYLNNTFSSKLSLTSDGNTEAGSVDLKTQKLKVTGQNGVNVAIENQGISVGLDTATKNKIDKIDDIESNVDGLTTKFNNTAFKYKSTNPNVGTTGTSSSADQSYSLNSENAFVFEGDKNIITTATAGKVSFGLNSSLSGINSITGQNGTASITFNQNDLTINSKQIKGVNKGTDDKDVATIAQLKDLANKLAGGTGTTSVGGDGSITTPTFSLPNSGTGTGGTTTHNNIGSALTALDTKLGNIINAATNQTITYYKDTNDKKTVKLTDGLHFQAGNNLNLTVAENGSVLYGLSPTLTGITSIAGNGNTLSFVQNGGGFDFGNKKLTGVSKGTTNADAVNYEQLKALAQALGATVENDGSVTKPIINISVGKDGTPGANGAAGSAGTSPDNTVTTINDAITALDNALANSTLSFKGDADAPVGKVKLRGQQLQIAGTSGEITTSTTEGGQKLTIALSQDVKDAIAKAKDSGNKDLGNLSDTGKGVITGLVKATNDNTAGKGGSFVEVSEDVDQTTKVKTIKVGIDEDKLKETIDISYKANSTNSKTVSLKKGLDFKNGTNTTATVEDDGVVKFSLNKDLTGIDSIANTDAKSKITLGEGSVTLSGDNNSAITLTGVAAGKGANDAINKQQLSDALAKLGGGAGVDGNGNITAPSYTLNNSNGLNGTNGTAGTNGAAGTVGAALDALDGAIGKLDEKLGNTKIKYKAASETNANEVALNTGLHFQSGNNNITAETAADGVVKYTLSNALTGINSIEKGTNGSKISLGTDTITLGKGVNAAEAVKLTGLADGAITANSKDAITGKQLSELATALGLNPNGNTFTPPTFTNGINGKDGQDGAKPTSVKDAIEKLIETVNGGLKFIGDKNPTANHKPQMLGSTLDIKAGNVETDYKSTNLKTEYTLTDGNGVLTIGFKDAPTFTNITADSIGKGTGKPTMTFADDKISLGTGADSTNPVTLTGVAAGKGDNDAINKEQLNEALAKLGGNAGVDNNGNITGPTYTLDKANGLNGTNGTAGANGAAGTVGAALSALDGAIGKLDEKLGNTKIKYKAADENQAKEVALSTGLHFKSGDSNLTVATEDGGIVKYTLSNALTGINSIQNGTNGSKISLGVDAITLGKGTSGTDAVTLTGVAKGKNANDAINKQQLSDALAKLGGNAGVDDQGNITGPSYNLPNAGGNKTDVGSALTALDTKIGEITTAAGAQTISYYSDDQANAKKSVALKDGLNFKNGSNLSLTVAENGAVTYGLNPTLTDITSIAGNGNTLSFVQNGGGFNFGDKKLTGVSKGTANADAVNYEQLKALADAMGAKVGDDGTITKPTVDISVGKDGTPGANGTGGADGAGGTAGTGTDNTVTTIGDAIEALDNALTKTTLSFAGDDNSTGSVKLRDQTLTIAGAENTITTKAEGQKLTIDLHQNIKDAITKANSSGDKDLSNLSDAGKDVVTGLVKATKDNTDGKGKDFVEVTESIGADKAKTITVGINEDKLKETIDISYKANAANSKTVSLKKGFDFTNTPNITATVEDEGVVKFSLNKDLTGVDSITKADGKSKISLGDDAITLGKGATGTDAVKLTGLAEGAITENSKDAVTGHQLSKLATALGLKPNTNNGFDAPTITNGINGVDGTAATAPTTITGAINDLIATVNKGLKFGGNTNAQQGDAHKAQMLGSTLDIKAADIDASFKGGNLTTKYTLTGGNGTLSIGFKDAPTFTNITADSIGKGTGKPTVTFADDKISLGTGANASTPVTLAGVAAGKGANDAINKQQLSDALAKLGGGATVGADGTITAPTYTLDKVNAVNGTNGADATKNTVEGALSALDTAIGKLSENLTGAEIKYKAGGETDAKAVALSTGLTFKPVATVNGVDTTKNLTISTADAGVVNFSLNKDLTGIDSIKKGDGKGALSLGDNTASLESAAGKSKVDLTADKAELTLGEDKSSVKLEEGKATVESAKDASAVKLENEKATLTAGKDKAKVEVNADNITFTPATDKTITITNAGKITGLAEGTVDANSTDVVVGKQLHATNEATLTFNGDSGSFVRKNSESKAFNIKSGDFALSQGTAAAVNYKGKNLATYIDNGTLKIGLREDPEFNKLTIENGPVLSSTGIDMNDKAISELAKGKANSDAVTVKQLEDALAKLGGKTPATVDDNGEITAPSFELTNSDKLNKPADSGNNGAGGANGGTGGATGGTGTGTTASTPKATVGDALTALDNAIGKLSENLTGAEIKYKAGDETDAKAVALSTGLTFKPAATVENTDATKNLTISTANDGVVSFKLNDQLKGLASLEGKGTDDTTKGKISFTEGSKDISVNGGKLTSLADGAIGENSTDAVTGKQLSKLATALGLNPNGNTFTPPTFTNGVNGANGQNGTTPTTIKGAIDDLIAAVNRGLKFSGNKNPEATAHKAQMLGSTLDIKAGVTVDGYSAGNLTTKYTLTNGDGVLTIGFKDAPTFTNITADSIGKGANKPTMTFGEDKISLGKGTNGTDPVSLAGVANGSADNEAVTAKQLKDALAALGGEAGIIEADAAGKKKGDIKAPSYTLTNADKLTNGAGAGGTTAATPKANVGAALTALDSAIGELSKGLTDQVIKYWSGDNANAKKSVKLSEGLNFKVADTNLTVSHGENGLITYGLSPTLSNLTSATFNGGANGTGTTTTINKDGVKVKNGTNETALSDNALTFKETPADTTAAADPKKDISISRDGEKLKLSNGDKATDADTSVTLSNLKGGTIAENGKDAATSGQLYDTAKSVADNLGGGATVGSDGKVSQPSYHLTTATTGGTAPTTPNATGKVFNNVGDALTSLDSTISTLKSDSVSTFKVKSDEENEEITVDNGKDTANNTNTVSIKGGKNITTKIENKAVVVDLDDNLTGLTTVEAGTDDNKTTLTKDGVTTTKAENGVTKEAKQNADGFSVKAGDKTTKVTADGVENEEGLVLKGGKDAATTLTVNDKGVALNDKKVTGLVDGAIGDDSKDAVTGKQLKSVLDNIQASLGAGTVDPATGKVKDVKFNLKAGTDTDTGKDYNSVNAALGALDGALTNLSKSSIDEITIGADATKDGVTLNKKNKRIDVVGSEGITTAVDGNKITVKLDKTINNMETVNFKANDEGTTTKVDQAGMTITNTDAAAKSSHTIVNKDGLSLTGKDGEKVAVNKDNVKLENKDGKSSQLDAGKLTLANSKDKKLVLEAGANGGVIKGLENRTADADDYGTDANTGRVATEGAVKALADSGLKVNADQGGVKTHKLGKEIAVVGAIEEISHTSGDKTINGTADNIVTKVGQDKDGKTTIQVGLASELKGLKEINLVKGATADKPEAKLVLNGDGLDFRTGTGDTAKTVKLEMGTQGGKLTGLESRNTDSKQYGVGENLGRVATESAVKKNRDDVESGVVGNIVYTDNDGNRLAKADDGNYYKSSDVTAGKANTGAKAVDNPVLSLTNANGRNADNVGEGVVLNNVKNGDISENSKQAVNGGQIYQVIQHIHNSTQRIDNLQNQVNTLSKDMRSGVAQAIAQANLPVNVLPGKSTLSVAAGSYMGKQAVAVGYSRVSDSGKVSVKFSLGHSGNKTSMGAGIGYSW